jgi:anti-sigma factor RsiW
MLDSLPDDARDMIMLLLDEQLEQGEAMQLFSRLSKEPDLCTCFFDSLHMQYALLGDAAALIPPKVNAGAMLGAAGIGATASGIQSMLQKLPEYLQIAYMPVLYGIIGALLTAIGFTVHQGTTKQIVYSTAASGDRVQSSVLSGGDNHIDYKPDMNGAQGHNWQNKRIAVNSPEHHIQHMAHAQQLHSQRNQYAHQEITGDTAMGHLLIEENKHIPFITLLESKENKMPLAQNADLQTGMSKMLLLDPGPVLPQFSVHIRRSTGIGIGSSKFFDDASNICFGITFPVNQYSALGIECGQEKILSDVQETEYRRFSVITFAGLQYKLQNYEHGLCRPFGQVLLGATQLGGLIKFSAGVDLHLTQDLSLMAGAESTLAQIWKDGALRGISNTTVFTGLRYSY